MTETKTPTGLELLRGAFTPNQISKLPKGTKKQNECPDSEKRKCAICGGWHHPQIIHLDYVGHAALTDRLLDADPLWAWEPFALKEGLPAFDTSGGLWIKLTVCGHTRIGYGHAAASSFKEIGSREKEVIGDALRNAAMRFGAALDLWHKGDLHVDIEVTEVPSKTPIVDAMIDRMKELMPDIPEPEIIKESPVKMISEAQRKRLFAIAKSAGWPTIELKQYLQEVYGLGSSKGIPVDVYDKIITWIESHTGYGEAAA